MTSMTERIIALHGETILRRSALRLNGEAAFQRAFAGRRTCVEIGTYRGCAAAAIAQYVGEVITLDLRHGKLERGREHWDRGAFWEALGVRNIVLHRIGDDREKGELVSSLEFDCAFIDGAHDEGSVRRDFALVKRCGRVLFHDAGANPFVGTLPQDELEYMDGAFALWSAK